MKHFRFIVNILLVAFIFYGCSDNDDTGPKTCTEDACSGHGRCYVDLSEPRCDCAEGYYADGLECLPGSCIGIDCEYWQRCNNGGCTLKEGFCEIITDCPTENFICNESTHTCSCPVGLEEYTNDQGIKDCREPEVVECTDDTTCDTDWQYCNIVENICTRIPGKCNSDSHCDPTDTCDLDTHECVSEVEDLCDDVTCDEWKKCDENTDGECDLKPGRCDTNSDCSTSQICNDGHFCETINYCEGVDCENDGICTVESGAAFCNCTNGFMPDQSLNNQKCIADTSTPVTMCRVHWPESISLNLNDPAESAYVYARLISTADPIVVMAQLVITDTDFTYPVIDSQITSIFAEYNAACEDEGEFCHGTGEKEFMADFPSHTGGSFKYIFRFSTNSGTSWTYCDQDGIISDVPTAYGTALVEGGCEDVVCEDVNSTCNDTTGLCDCNNGYVWSEAEQSCIPDEPNPCDDANCGANGDCNEATGLCECDNGYEPSDDGKSCNSITDLCNGVDCNGKGTCISHVGLCQCEPEWAGIDCSDSVSSSALSMDGDVTISDDGYSFKVKGSGSYQITRNGWPVDVSDTYNDSTETFTISKSGLAPGKYTYLFRGDESVRPLYIPIWVGAGAKYSGFHWKDCFMYQLFNDRFLDGDSSNNVDNNMNDLDRVEDVRSQWQGGDYAGILKKLREGYFDDMNVTALWISSPVLNPRVSNPPVNPDKQYPENSGRQARYASYHSYHPIATGWSHYNHLNGIDSPLETAFGTEQIFKELINEAHKRGIRIVADFVANHVHMASPLWTEHPEWFWSYMDGYNMCHNHWDQTRSDGEDYNETCWFTSDTPDFNFRDNPTALEVVLDHAIWLVQEFNLDGYRLDALKHMDMGFTTGISSRIKQDIEATTSLVFYTMGESLGARYWHERYVGADMVVGQVDDVLFNKMKWCLLENGSLSDLKNFTDENDTYYQNNIYSEAIMGNFFGNHDKYRALTMAGGDYGRLRKAQTFIMTTPGAIPMIYQGDEIGMFGGEDPDNRKMMKFNNLSSEERKSHENLKILGKVRSEQRALRWGWRETVSVDDSFWVYKVTDGSNEVYVAINNGGDRGYTPPSGFSDKLGNCSNGNVPGNSSCVFVK